MRLRVILVALAVSLIASAQMKLSHAQLTEFIQSAVTLHQDDRKVAEYLKKVQLTERISDRDVEELQGLGAGPKTVAELHRLRDESAALPVPKPLPPKPVYVPPPPPDSVEQLIATTYAALIAPARKRAVGREKSRRSFKRTTI